MCPTINPNPKPKTEYNSPVTLVNYWSLFLYRHQLYQLARRTLTTIPAIAFSTLRQHLPTTGSGLDLYVGSTSTAMLQTCPVMNRINGWKSCWHLPGKYPDWLFRRPKKHGRSTFISTLDRVVVTRQGHHKNACSNVKERIWRTLWMDHHISS